MAKKKENRTFNLMKCELWYVKCDPKRPNATFNKENPTWEIQIRTSSKAQRTEWKEHGLNVKPLRRKLKDAEGNPIIDEETDEEVVETVKDEKGNPVFYSNLKKKSIKGDGEPAKPVVFLNGALDEIDPNTVGNGSVANIRIFQYDFTDESTGELKHVSSPQKAQVIKHVVYERSSDDDGFEMTETEVIHQEDSDENDEVDEKPAKGKGKPKAQSKPKLDDLDDEIPFN